MGQNRWAGLVIGVQRPEEKAGRKLALFSRKSKNSSFLPRLIPF